MATVKTLSKGQIVIPVQLRRKFNIHPGSKLQVMEHNGIIYLIPLDKDPIKTAYGMLPAKPSLSKQLLKERKKDFK